MKELKLNQRWSLPGLPFFNVTVQGAVKAVAVINIIGCVLCALMVTRDILTREGFQQDSHSTEVQPELVLNNSATRTKTENDESSSRNGGNLVVGPSVAIPFHYLTWTLLYLKDAVDFVVSILLFQSVGERNLFYCKLYFFSTFLVLQAFTVYVIDTTLLRVSFVFTVSVIIGWCFHIFYKPYSVWVILNYMKVVIEEDKDQENKARRSPKRLTENELTDFYKGSSILTLTPIEVTMKNEVGSGPKLESGLSGLSPYMRNDIFVPVLTTTLRHEATLYAFNQEYELNANEFTVDESKLLGSGEFGAVFMGELLRPGEKGRPVAIKTTKSDSQSLETEYFRALLDEIKIMCHIGKHPNIVNLIGVCTSEIQNRKLWIIIELCENGSLQKYLSRNKGSFMRTKPLGNKSKSSEYIQLKSQGESIRTNDEIITTEDLIQWAHEISIGMEFLVQKKVYHGDLALRNILLTGNRQAKIADFGLARKLYNYVLYARDEETALPWRWMAPESLRNLTFSQTTDVWTYGVTLWEIFTLGEPPWEQYEYGHGPEFMSGLLQGLRLPRPAACPAQIYKIMEACWQLQEDLRPTFTQLVIYTGEARRGISVTLE